MQEQTDGSRPFGPSDELEIRIGGQTRLLMFDYGAIGKIELLATKTFGMRTTVFDLIASPSPLALALMLVGGVDHAGQGGLADSGVKKKPTVDKMLKWVQDDKANFLEIWVSVTRTVRGAFPELAEMAAEAKGMTSGEAKTTTTSLTDKSDDNEP